jgi:outer membrane biosynthesis protein TonB
VVPIGGRLGAAAAPALDELEDDFIDDEPTRVGTALDFEKAEQEAREAEAKKKAEAEAREKAEAEAREKAEAEAREKAQGPAASAPDEDAFDPFASGASAPSGDLASSPGAQLAPESSPGAFAAPPGGDVASSPGSFAAPPEQGAVAAPQQEPARRRGLPIGAWIAIAGAMAFGVALAVMVGTHFLTQSTPEPVASNTPEPEPEPEPSAQEATPDPELVEAPDPEEPEAADPEAEPGEGAEEAEPEQPAAATARSGSQRPSTGGGGGTRSPRTGSTGGGGSRQGSGQQLDEEARARLARFSDDSTGAAQLNVSGRSPLDDDRGGGATSLNSEQIGSVVRREQRAVQQCWQTALRQVGSAPSHDTRIEVMVTIGGSGTVTSARARGRGIGNLTTCIERTVRRWRFPRTGGTTRTSIPFVFQGSE